MIEREFQRILRGIREDLLDGMRRHGFYYGPSRKLRYDATPWDVNNGLCDTFADWVVEAVPEAEALYVAELDPTYVPGEEPMECAHAMVLWHEKYYDAECISGVKDWRELPIIKNHMKSRVRVLRERKASEGKDCI